jgi:hypothetical protein
MLKLGIVLYGITRDQARVTAPVFHNLIVDPLKKIFDVSIFLHAFLLDECQVDWLLNRNVMPIKNRDDYKLYKSHYTKTTNQKLWSRSFDYKNLERGAPPASQAHDITFKNYINSLYSLSESFNQTLHNPCDLYFISRLDLLYKNNDGVVDACLDLGSNLNHNILYTPSWSKNGGLNDRLAICNASVAKVYCNRFYDFLQYKTIIKNGRRCGKNVHSETMLSRCSDYNYFTNKFFQCKTERIRVDGSTRKF